MDESKLFIGNLPYEVTSEELGQFFSQFGQVQEAVVITDRHSGRSKGYGFVRYGQMQHAEMASQEINGREYKGRKLVVNIALPVKKAKTQMF